eukprot:2663709-Pleurochrysis_carterae.AAC.2
MNRLDCIALSLLKGLAEAGGRAHASNQPARQARQNAIHHTIGHSRDAPTMHWRNAEAISANSIAGKGCSGL